MSTKIYQAYRVPQDKFPEALRYIYDKFIHYSYEIYEQMINGVDESKLREEYKLDDDEKITADLRKWFVHDTLGKLWKESELDFLGCGFNAWFHTDGMVYIIPWGKPRITYKLDEETDRPTWMEEYIYFNNTDKPEDISREEWEERAKVWEEVGPNDGIANHFRYRMLCEVVTARHFGGLVVLDQYHQDQQRENK